MRTTSLARVLLVLPLVGLAACGDRADDRAISGAGIGAAAGLAVGAVTGLSLLEGAAIGAAVGGVTGAVTDSKDVNLGTPAWRKSNSGSANAAPANQPPRGSAYNNLVYRTQSALAARGYDVGTPDGVMGPKTRAAIERYQVQNGILVDGQPSENLLTHIEQRS
jgi:peptidoglycan hydrolase-like protein with peptidoglycan-binding domain